MTNSIVPVQLIEVSDIGGELVVDSRLIANRLGIEHDTLFKTIEKYGDRLSTKSELRFKVEFRERPQGGKSKVRYVLLDERQATLLMTYSRNTEQVLDCKDALVEAFAQAKQIIKTVIPAQNDRIRELELEVRALELRKAENDRQDFRLGAYGLSTTLLLEGKADSVVEVDRPILEVIDHQSGVKFSGQTTKQLADYLNKNGGRSFKSGAELERELNKLGRADLIDTVPRKSLQPFISKENLAEACRVLVSSRQQQLL
jgi:phage regulator Rha-like protein